jgi:hypothetical protein
MGESKETAFELLIPHEQLAEAIEPAMRHLHNPPPGSRRRMPSFFLGFLPTPFHMGHVAMRFNNDTRWQAGVAGIGTERKRCQPPFFVSYLNLTISYRPTGVLSPGIRFLAALEMTKRGRGEVRIEGCDLSTGWGYLMAQQGETTGVTFFTFQILSPSCHSQTVPSSGWSSVSVC